MVPKFRHKEPSLAGEFRIIYEELTRLVSFLGYSSFSSFTGSGTIPITSDFVKLDATAGDITVTLPTAVGNEGKNLTLKRIDGSANSVAVNTGSSQTIDGNPTASLPTQWDTINLVSDGENWLTR